MQERGDVAEAEAWEVFNMGCGFVAIVPATAAPTRRPTLLAAHHPGTRRIGTVTDEAGRVTVPGRYSSGQGSRESS